MVVRRWNHLVHILTMISSPSARLSATHGDPRLPNLKRRVPEEKKTAQKAGSHGEANNGLHTPAGLYIPGIRLLKQLRLRLSSAVGVYNAYPCLTSTTLRKARSSDPRFIPSLAMEGLGLAGLFGNIGRHAVSEKKITQHPLSFAGPLHMQGEAPPHAAYEVGIRRHARLKSNYGTKSLVRYLKTAYGALVLPDTFLRALAGKPPKYDLLK